MSTGCVRRLIAPWEFPPVNSARRFLPLRFRRQTFPRPAAKSHGAKPGNFYHRAFFMPRVREPSAIAPVHPGITVADIEILFSASAFRSDSIEKSSKLSVGHLMKIDGKFRDGDLVHWPFILRPVIASHQKLPSVNADPIGSVSIDRTGKAQRLQKNNQSCRCRARETRAQEKFHGKNFLSILRNESGLRKPERSARAEAIRSTKVHPMAAGAVIFSRASSGMRQR